MADSKDKKTFEGRGSGSATDSNTSANGKHMSASEIKAYEDKIKSGANKKTAAAEAFKGKDGVGPKKLTD